MRDWGAKPPRNWRDAGVSRARTRNRRVVAGGAGFCPLVPSFEALVRPALPNSSIYRPSGTLCAADVSVYLEYYGLTEPPFDITPNPRFLFYSPKHREAFNHLLYGIRERKGFVQMTGEVGAGKTTLCRAMLEQLDERYATALILNPIMSASELVKAIARSLACR